jgi:hypothetical protein
MGKRKSNAFLAYLLINFLLLAVLLVHAQTRQRTDLPILQEKRRLVSDLELTDFCLFTDARYTRHPSMADLNTPFQDYPFSFEHFPSGSIMPLPPHLRQKSRDE